MSERLTETPEGEAVRAEVAVVGSGVAGTEVATFLAARGHSVVVLESGRDEFDEAINGLSDVEFAGRPHRVWDESSVFHGYLPPEYRGRSRLRQLGGTSCSWTGKWRLFEPRDFERRPWVPESGWPIGFADLAPAYAEVAADYGIGIGAGDGFDPAVAEAAGTLDAAGFKVVQAYQNPTPYRAAERLKPAEGPRLRVLTDATVTEIVLAEGSDRVGHLVARAWGGAERRIEARHVVLATGGLETPRLLLASRRQREAGLGNGHDLVGRFYQDHLKINPARLVPGPLMARVAGAVQVDPKPRVVLCLGLSAAEQARMGVLEATIFFRPVYAGALAQLRGLALGRARVRDGNGTVDHYKVTYAVEQEANPASRVHLGPERDAMGVPKLVVDWRLTELDRRSFVETGRALVRLAQEAGLGALDLGAGGPDFERATDAAHHMGTTRMAASPREGVVDPHCTVWGHPNLHVASSAVFATGAAYSPTFTIMALARRLAKRLDATLARPVATAGAA